MTQFYNLDPETAVLSIEGEIVASEGWIGENVTAADAFRAELAALGGKPVTVRVNSPGGDVMAAAAMYTALMDYRGSVTVEITGMAASAASVIAMAGDVVKISPVAYMMVHNPWTITMGDEREHRHAAKTLNELREGLINAYEIKTGADRDHIIQLLNAETWMSAQTAIDEGFADALLFESDKPLKSSRMSAAAYSGTSYVARAEQLNGKAAAEEAAERAERTAIAAEMLALINTYEIKED